MVCDIYEVVVVSGIGLLFGCLGAGVGCLDYLGGSLELEDSAVVKSLLCHF